MAALTDFQQKVGLVLTGAATIFGLDWLDRNYKGGVPASPKVDGVGALGSARAAAARYAGSMRRGIDKPIQTEILDGKHVIVTFDPSAYNTVWGQAHEAEMAANTQGVNTAMAMGEGKLGVVFTGDPQSVEEALALEGYTDIEPSALW